MKLAKAVLFIFLITFFLSFFPSLIIQAKGVIAKQSRIYVEVSALKIRNAPNLKAEAVGKLEKGDSFVVLEKGGEQTTVEYRTSNWGRVSVKGMKGWVFLGFTSDTPPELLSPKEIENIASKYKRDVQKCEEREAAAMAADPEYQNCSSCGCNLQTSETLNIDRGCKEYKLKEIAELARQNGESNGVPDSKYFEAYNDEYCIKARGLYYADCTGMKLKLSDYF
jgi:hypothetical protein